MIVADASAFVELLSNDGGKQDLVRQALRFDAEWMMPEHGTTEIANALRRIWLGRRSSDEGFDAHLVGLGRLRITTHSIRTLLPRIRELAANATAYDAAYIALAEALDVPLITIDGKLARVPGIRAEVHVIGA